MFLYCEMIDAGDVDGLVELFADAVLGGFEANARVAGARRDPGDVRRRRSSGAHSGTRRTKHITTNVCIEVDEDAGTAIARSYWVLLTSAVAEHPDPISSRARTTTASPGSTTRGVSPSALPRRPAGQRQRVLTPNERERAGYPGS